MTADIYKQRISARFMQNTPDFEKIPFDECSAAMSFQVGFKSVGFFSVFECYCVFDFPRFVFGCVRNITFIVFFKAGFQVFGTADVEMGSGGFINENVNVVEVGHWKKS